MPQGCLQDRIVAQLLIPSGHRSWRKSWCPFSFAGVCARWTVAVLFGTVLVDPKCNFLLRSRVPGVLPSSWFGRGERDRLTRESLQLWLSHYSTILAHRTHPDPPGPTRTHPDPPGPTRTHPDPPGPTRTRCYFCHPCCFFPQLCLTFNFHNTCFSADLNYMFSVSVFSCNRFLHVFGDGFVAD